MSKKNIFLLIIGLLILGTITTVVLQSSGSASVPTGPGKYDAFAQCLKAKGLTFYGAFWCPHCQAQKKLFGSSVQYLPYVECSTPDGQSQTPVCIAKDITSYPTWELPDGTRIPNENEAGVTLATLAAKSSCQLPQ
jgi:hypothetical protein